MADTQLQITTTVKDLASGPLKKIGAEAQDVGRKAAQGMAQAEQAASRAGGSFERAFGGGLKRNLGSLAIGISSAASASQGLDKSLVSVGANLAGAFAVGGPVGLGIAGLSTLLGHFIGKMHESEEAAKSFSENISKRISEAADRSQEMWDAERKSKIRLDAVKAGKDPDKALHDAAIADAIKQAQDTVALKDAEIERLRRQGSSNPQVRQSIGALTAERTDAQNRVDALRNISANEKGEEAAKAANDQRKKDADEAKKQEEEARKEAEQRKKVTDDLNKDIKDQVELLQAATEREKLLVEQAHERRDVAAKNGDLASLAIKHAEQLKDLEAKQAEEAAKTAAQQKAKADAIADANRDSEYELALTRATSDEERLRIQQQRELNRARKEGLDLYPIQQRHAEEINQLHAKERKALEDKKKAEQEFIDKLREEGNIANAQTEQQRQAWEKFYARKKAMEEAAKLGPDAVRAQRAQFDAEDKKAKAAANAAKLDPLNGWSADSGMGPNAWLRAQKKQERQRKHWERNAANLRAEALDRMGITINDDDSSGWQLYNNQDTASSSKGGSGGGHDGGQFDPNKRAPDAGSPAGRGEPVTTVTESAQSTADAAKSGAEALGRAAEAAKSMATESAHQTEAATTTASSAEEASKAAQDSSKALQDVATGVQAAATAMQTVATAAQNVKQNVDDLKKRVDAIAKALGM